MVYRVIVTPSELLVKLQTLKASRDPLFIYFVANRPANNERWCADCRSADPMIDEALHSAPASATLLEVQITRPEWKESPGPAHFLRRPPFKVTSVPTVMQFDPAAQACTKRFVDGECEQIEALAAMFMGSNFDSAM